MSTFDAILGRRMRDIRQRAGPRRLLPWYNTIDSFFGDKERETISLIDWIKRRLIPWYTGLGLTRRTVTLEVTGRKTGKPIRLSLSRTDYGGRSYFVSLAGESSWVRNVRAAEGRAVIIARRRIPVRLVEIPRAERAAAMHAYVQERAFTHSGAQSAQHFFGLGPRPTLREMEGIAYRFVVFEILREEQR